MFALAFIVGPAAGAALFQASQAALWITCGVLPLFSAALVMSIDRATAEGTQAPREGDWDVWAPSPGAADPAGSALDPGEGDPLDEGPLGEEEQDDDGEHEQQ